MGLPTAYAKRLTAVSLIRKNASRRTHAFTHGRDSSPRSETIITSRVYRVLTRRTVLGERRTHILSLTPDSTVEEMLSLSHLTDKVNEAEAV